MTEGESHALAQSLIHTVCGYETWRQLNVHYYGRSVTRQYANLRHILSPTWANHNSASEMFKHYIPWLQTIQEYEWTRKTGISDDIKIASIVNSIRGQLKNHLLQSMDITRMRPRHLTMSRRKPLEISSSHHMPFSRPTVEGDRAPMA
eukprot:2749712-Amphidinium_carterae.2